MEDLDVSNDRENLTEVSDREMAWSYSKVMPGVVSLSVYQACLRYIQS